MPKDLREMLRNEQIEQVIFQKIIERILNLDCKRNYILLNGKDINF